MRTEQILVLLNGFIQTGKAMRANECAELLQMSVSSLKKDIRDMKQLLMMNGCAIEGKTGLGNGYELQINDEDKFYQYIHKVLPEEIREHAATYSEQKNRVRFLIDFLLNAEDYIRSDELSETLSISRSQLSKDMLLVKQYFTNFGIELSHKPHYGMKIHADEVSIRLCYANTYLNEMNLDERSIYIQPETREVNALNDIRMIVLSCAQKNAYQLTDLSIQNLVIHLYIAIFFMKQNTT